MNVLTSKDREAEIEKLLKQYQLYKNARSITTKRRIGDEMIFKDPVIWMMYKFLAYKGTPNAITTWEDLVSHSLSDDGICGKRLHWLSVAAIEAKYDLLVKDEKITSLSISEVARLPVIVDIADSEVLMLQWNQYEGHMHNGSASKWGNYRKQ